MNTRDASSLKIGFFLPWLKGGGTEMATLRVLNELAERPETSVCLAVHQAGGTSPMPIHERVAVAYLGGSLLGLNGRYRQWLEEARPGVVFSAINHVNLVNVWSGRGRTCVIPTVHNHLGEKLRRTGKPGERLLKELSLRCVLPHADCVVGVSEDICRYLIDTIGLDEVRTVFIPPPVRVAQVRAQAKELATFPESGDRPVLVASGRMVVQKGFDVLIRAMALFERAERPALWLLGDGELMAAHQQLTSELGLEADVVFLGRQANPFPYVQRADCFVLPSRWEGFPLVLLEAIALGRPVVANDCRSGPREILENGKWGILTPVNDSEALFVGIREALSRQWDCAALRERSEAFDVSRVAAQFYDVAVNTLLTKK
ncbi:glycosyltransferase [Cerasicoccus arenae]|nr:glycosyltransferase [Cerasicoccus arenae]MBK1858065.1 glycosyltransferase [Cerasicoccus arenae]